MQKGQQIRDYVLDQKIGEGGMGEVWSATHQVLHRPVAIKAMAAHLAADPQFEQRFLDEARAQAILQHPRILGVTDFFREGGVYYLVMPLVHGRPLDDRLAEAGGPLPLGEATAIASDLLDALDYAHQRGIIHRDVKPSNILLDRAGQAYLTDFGIALLVGQQDRRTRTGTSLGTPHYMSPDQIRSPRTIDHRADVYSAACVIYEMLAGRPPFLAEDGEGDADFALKEAHLRKDPEPIRRWNPAVPLAVDLVVLRGLAKEPDQRYGGCGELRRALGAAAAGLTPPPLQAPPRPVSPPVPPPLPASVHLPPPLPSPAPVPRPSRGGFFWGIALGVVLAFVALVVIGVMMANKHKEEAEVEESTTVAMEEPPALVTGSPPALIEPPPPPSPSANVVNVWVDHNAQQEGRTGMLIHTHFLITGAQYDECQLNAYFYAASGEPLKDFDEDYRSVSSQASVSETFTPPYEETEYKDFTLFMPEDELHMAKGQFNLKFDVQLHHIPTQKMLADSPWVEFTYTGQ